MNEKKNRLFNYLTNPSNAVLKKSIFFLFLLVFTVLITYYFILNQSFSNYVYSEWLVNYAGGFVRRGLTGSIIFWLREQFNWNNPQMYLIVVYFNYIIFLIWTIIYLFKVNQSLKILNPETLLVFLFLPSLIFFPLNDLSGLGRKEYLFFLGLLINLWLVSRTVNSLYLFPVNEQKAKLNNENINKYSYQLFIFYNLFSIPTALSHEAILFLVLPLNLIITATLLGVSNSPIKVITKTLLIYSPTILVSFISMIFKGNQEVAITICKSWQEYNIVNNCNEIPRVLYFYGISTLDVIKENFRLNIIDRNGLIFLSWIFAFLLNIIILMRASEMTINKLVKDENRKLDMKNQNLSFSSENISISFSFKYIFIPFLCSFILYIIAFDWGRWFMIICVTYAVCLLTPSLISLEMYSYKQNQWLLYIIKPIFIIYTNITLFIKSKFIIKKHYFAYFILLIYTLFFIRVPHYAMNFIDLSDGLIPIHIYRIFGL